MCIHVKNYTKWPGTQALESNKGGPGAAGFDAVLEPRPWSQSLVGAWAKGLRAFRQAQASHAIPAHLHATRLSTTHPSLYTTTLPYQAAVLCLLFFLFVYFFPDAYVYVFWELFTWVAFCAKNLRWFHALRSRQDMYQITRQASN